MTDEENRLLLTDAFWRLAQSAFHRGVMVDVVTWEAPNSSPHIAFVGDAMKVAQLFDMLGGGGDANAYLSQAIGRAIPSAMGIEISREDLSNMWGRASASLGDLLDRFSKKLAWQWVDAHGPVTDDDDGVDVGFIAEPGYPWPTKGDRYWSAKQQRWLPSKKPGWLIEVVNRDAHGAPLGDVHYGVNPCVVFPADESKTEPGGPVCGAMPGLDMPIMVTHSMSLLEPNENSRHHHQLDMAIAGIKECGGLLFPSLAVGPIPATNFGPVVLVAHLELVLSSLLPYRRHRRRRPCWVYGLDAWTDTTGSLMRETAIELFDEFHGHADWYRSRMSVLGIPASTSRDDYTIEPLKSTKQLASALKKRMRGWPRELSFDGFKAKDRESPEVKYAYSEAKAREVVSLDEFPFLIAPRSMKSTVQRFVRGVGYRGKVVFVTEHDELRGAMAGHTEEQDYQLYRWAWTVADEVLGLRDIVEIET